MPKKTLVLILASVWAAGLLTVWVGTLVAGYVQAPGDALFIVIPLMLIGYVLWRFVSGRQK